MHRRPSAVQGELTETLGVPDDLRVGRRPDAGLVLRRGAGERVEMSRFTRAEVACFLDGLLNEEFTPLRSA